MEPIYYPLFGKIIDTRTNRKIRVSNFKALLLSDFPISQITTPNYSILSLSGIYRFSFTSLKDWIKSYNLLNQNESSKSKKSYSVEIQYDIIEISGDITKFGEFIRDYYIRLINSYATDDNNYINIYLFGVLVSVTLSTFEKTHAYEKLISLIFNNRTCAFNEIDDFMTIAPSQFYSSIFDNKYSGFLVPSPSISGIIVKNGIPQYNLIGHNLSYQIFWISSEVETQELVELIAREDSLICCYHIFPTFHRDHIHIFKTVDDGINYIFHCLYRSYKAQFKFQTKNTVQNTDRRGSYIPLSSRILQREFIKRFLISPNAAFFLPCWTNNLEFLSLNCDKFKELFRQYAERQFLTIIENDLDDILQHSVVFSGMRDLLPRSDLVLRLNVGFVLHNVLDADTNNFSTLVYDGNPTIRTQFPIRPSYGLLNDQIDIKFNSSVDSLYMLGMSLTLPVQDVDAEHRPILDLVRYRLSHDFTGPLKTLFKNILSPQNYERVFFSAEIFDTLTVFQRLYLSAYVYDTDINWRVENGELIVISSELLSRGSYNQWNTSSFKALWGITNFFVIDVMGLQRNASILFLGATDEPSIHMLRHFLRSNWMIKATGLFTRDVGARAEFLYDYVGKEHNFIYSDIDMSVFVTLEQIVIFFNELVTKILTLFTEKALIKIEYTVPQVLFAVLPQIPFRATVHKIFGSKPGSLETFLLINKLQPPIHYDNATMLNMCTNASLTIDPVPFGRIDMADYSVPYRYDLNSGYILQSTTSNDYYTDLSCLLNVCSKVFVGRPVKDKSIEQFVTLVGIFNYERYYMFMRNRLFLGLNQTLVREFNSNGYIDINNIVVKPVYPTTAFTIAQRFLGAITFKEDALNQHYVHYHDVGCRNFHCIIFLYDPSKRYIGYDETMVVVPPRIIQFINERVTIDGIVNMLGNQTNVVIAYNSIFMTYQDTVQLENDIIRCINSMVPNTSFILSFYCLDQLTIDNLTNFGIRAGRAGNNLRMSFGTYQPVAAVRSTFFRDLVAGLHDNHRTHMMNVIVDHSALYYSQLLYGNAPNLSAHYALPLFNACQKLLIVRR
uniref:130 kDa protein n=1 Tax=Diaphorina citri reovirus TaxID=557218 RepID=A0A0U3K9N2_9REOV|nr:130 kDa protein [Diaphorina citri reovirus]